MSVRRYGARAAAAAAALLMVVSIASCATGTTGVDKSSSTTPSSAVVQRDAALAAKLPERIKASGRLIVGTNLPYSPAEFTGPDGRIVGFDVEVVEAVSKILGVTPEFRSTEFANIIPGVEDGTYDIGMRLIFDTAEREQHVDMVTYFSGGTQWVQRAGDNVDPNNGCGLRVGVENGTVPQISEIPAKDLACTTVGDPGITGMGFASVAEAMSALADSRVRAVSADSPVASYAVGQSSGKLALAGEPFDTEPYAFPVQRGSSLAVPLQQAIQQLIDSGALKAIAQRWQVDGGMITESRINGAARS